MSRRRAPKHRRKGAAMASGAAPAQAAGATPRPSACSSPAGSRGAWAAATSRSRRSAGAPILERVDRAPRAAMRGADPQRQRRPGALRRDRPARRRRTTCRTSPARSPASWRRSTGRHGTGPRSNGSRASPPTRPSCRAISCSRLHAAREAAGTPLACAESGGQTHPVNALWPVAPARGSAPRARRRGHAQDRPLDGAPRRRPGRLAGGAVRSRSSTPTRPEDLAEAERLIALHGEA